jgi:hypothetical protein
MNAQNFVERVNNSDINERTDQDTNSPVAVNSEDAGKTMVDAALNSEEPMVGTVVAADLMNKTITHEVVKVMNVESSADLLNREESERFRTRWNEIQGKFVDEPRSAVQQADALVSEVTEKITRMFTSEHSSLESQWHQGKDVSTEDLRKTLQHYRSFFNRLVV